ncbi:MAG: hypothetical protein DCF20_21115 [Pseudanabaena sp.]|nr:MAG: hypothetical protein DCF20_21115 [Pseudanabaena sp.]
MMTRKLVQTIVTLLTGITLPSIISCNQASTSSQPVVISPASSSNAETPNKSAGKTVISGQSSPSGLSSSPSKSVLAPNDAGEYVVPKRTPVHRIWKVVDSDPNGLNCRMPKQYQGRYFDELLQNGKYDIGSWDVLTTIKTGELINAYGGNLGAQIIIKDREDKSWLPVAVSFNNGTVNCFVRANKQFVEPYISNEPKLPNSNLAGILKGSHGLNSSQKYSLKELGFPIVVPTFLPDNFKVTKVNANLCANSSNQRGSCREGSNYTIIYQNPQNVCLLVNAVGGGVGGGAGEFEFNARSPLFGEMTVLFGKPSGSNQTPSSEKMNAPQTNIYSFPTTLKNSPGRSHLYNVVIGDSTFYQQTYGCSPNTSITPLEFVKVLESLSLLE